MRKAIWIPFIILIQSFVLGCVPTQKADKNFEGYIEHADRLKIDYAINGIRHEKYITEKSTVDFFTKINNTESKLFPEDFVNAKSSYDYIKVYCIGERSDNVINIRFNFTTYCGVYITYMKYDKDITYGKAISGEYRNNRLCSWLLDELDLKMKGELVSPLE